MSPKKREEKISKRRKKIKNYKNSKYDTTDTNQIERVNDKDPDRHTTPYEEIQNRTQRGTNLLV